VVTGAGDARITTQLVSGQLPVDTSQDKIMLCGSIPFNKEIMTWCKARGMKEGALHDPGQYVVERAFVTR
jgi:ferredoxin--NADP+ reductase